MQSAEVDQDIRMIDLHCHILPGIDDGAPDVSISLAMAKAFVADGVSTVACTPHILPGLYHNSGPEIRRATAALQQRIEQEGIPLRLVTGADNHVVPDFLAQLRAGNLLSLANTRYVLVEFPHHVAPPRIEEAMFGLITEGFVPILTHPERLSWIGPHYEVIKKLKTMGVWMQVTAGSLTCAFGRNALYWGERMLGDGLVHVLATDAHDASRRPPNLGRGRDAAAKCVGDTESWHLVMTRPYGVLRNVPPADLPQPLSGARSSHTGPTGDARNVKTLASEGSSVSRRGFADRNVLGRLRRLFAHADFRR
jgi:protein-tyrosine phosphatase